MSNKKIPELRFLGFKEEWQEKKLGDLSTGSSYGMNSAATTYDGKNKYLRITDISSTTNNFLLNDLVSPSNKLDDKYLLKEGDILFARTGASVGKSYYYKKEDDIVYFAGFLIRFQIKNKYNYKFIFYNTLTKTYKNWVTATSMRSGQPGINETEYSDFKLFLPSKVEQNKIGKFFELLDQNIKVKEKEIKKVKNLKKAYMQQLFNQELRFQDDTGQTYPNWKTKKLKEITEIFSGGTPSTTQEKYWNGAIAWATPTEITANNKYISKTEKYITQEGLLKSSAKLLPANSILMTSRATIGSVAINLVPMATNQGFKSFVPTKKTDVEFLYYYLQTFEETFKQLATGSTFLEISMTATENVKVRIPILEEQKKIGNFLSLIDQKIELKNKELEKIKKYKKVFLQEMFI